MTPVRRPRRTQKSTSERLLQAAAREFNEHGFAGTNTNRIARRARFAPQTFYRWFQDKTEIFLKTYERWQFEEFGTVSKLLAENASDIRLALAVVAHHEAYLVFRRSLRHLSVENDTVRAVRAQSRLNQIAYLRKEFPKLVHDDASLAATLFQIERLADALAEKEFRDMGLNKRAGARALARLLRDLRTPE